MCPIAHVIHCPCAPSPRCPISICSISQDTPLPMCPIAHVSKRCQVIKKMSSCQKQVKCQKVKHMNYGGGSQKNWHNEVHTYWPQFWCRIWWWLKTLKMCIESVFEQFWWPSYLTSKLTSICVNLIMSIYFFVNLPHSMCVWLFDIWHLFDNLTPFWYFDIFFNLNHLSLSQGYFSENPFPFSMKICPTRTKMMLCS